MASDDNPFARNSAWPKMPQAPFRVGPLPTASPQDDAPPEPRKITPLFVRPVDAEPSASPTLGGPTSIPGPIAPVHIAPPAAPPPEPPAEAPPQAPVEFATLFVEPPRRAKPARRNSLLPVFVASAVGVAGLVGLAMLLSGVQQATLKANAPPTPSSAAAAPAAAIVGPDPLPKPTPAPSPEAPLARVVIAKPRPTPAPARVRAQPPVPAAPLVAEDVAAAVEQTLSAPPLVLRLSPAEAPKPVVRDPDAPMTTRAPYS